jgi:hypothetical protein
MAAGAAVPGLFFCFAACVLLIFVSVSAPTWNAISFLNNGLGISFGVFGYTGSSIHVGYHISDAGINSPKLADSTLYALTCIMILQPIAAGLSGLAVLFGLCGAAYHRAGTVFMSLFAGLAFLATLIAWVVDMALWGIVKQQFHNHGIQAQYGNANWLTLGALVALFIGFFTGACGICGSYSKRRAAY